MKIVQSPLRKEESGILPQLNDRGLSLSCRVMICRTILVNSEMAVVPFKSRVLSMQSCFCKVKVDQLNQFRAGLDECFSGSYYQGVLIAWAELWQVLFCPPAQRNLQNKIFLTDCTTLYSIDLTSSIVTGMERPMARGTQRCNSSTSAKSRA